MSFTDSKPSSDDFEAPTGNAEWKCPSCGAMNEDFRKLCDGCGDPRPAVRGRSKKIEKESLAGPDEPSEEPSVRPAKKAPKSVKPKKTGTRRKSKVKKPKDDEVQTPEPEKLEPEKLELEKPEPVSSEPFSFEPEKLEPPATPEEFKPSFVLTGPTARPSDETITAPEPILPVEPISSPEPITSTSGQHYYIVFVNTPASSLVKSRVSIDFDDFPTVTIGRSPENVVVIPDQEVSRKHAQLSLNGDRVFLKDLNSANGTFIYNGKEFERVSDSVEVKPNSVLKFGNGTIVKLVSE